MMQENLIRSMILIWSFSLQIFWVSQVYALSPLSNGPLFLGGNISPNVMFTLDDSGSMHFEIMPENLILQDVRYMFPRASSVYGQVTTAIMSQILILRTDTLLRYAPVMSTKFITILP